MYFISTNVYHPVLTNSNAAWMQILFKYDAVHKQLTLTSTRTQNKSSREEVNAINHTHFVTQHLI